ncbi:MAG: M15 family metallopeptidase [Flavihumibacter sp.]|nr:M15 family metallopeptidase [Flavihumibacter sp.]
MVTPEMCFNKYGEPTQTNKWLTLWDVPAALEIGVIPKRIYCNKDLVKPLEMAFTNLIQRGFVKELKTWDGCFNIRYQRGSRTKASLHSWAIAIDVNAAWNGLGVEPKLSAGFVKCFTDAGFDWGGTWKRKDGMHFQLSKI